MPICNEQLFMCSSVPAASSSSWDLSFIISSELCLQRCLDIFSDQHFGLDVYLHLFQSWLKNNLHIRK